MDWYPLFSKDVVMPMVTGITSLREEKGIPIFLLPGVVL
jgi:hypothetical protein